MVLQQERAADDVIKLGKAEGIAWFEDARDLVTDFWRFLEVGITCSTT